MMLTTYDVDEYVFAALRAGASGFMLKDVRPAELVEGGPRGRRGRCAAGPRRHPAPADRFAEALPTPARAPPNSAS